MQSRIQKHDLRPAPSPSPDPMPFVDQRYFPFTRSDVLFMLLQCALTFDKGSGISPFYVRKRFYGVILV